MNTREIGFSAGIATGLRIIGIAIDCEVNKSQIGKTYNEKDLPIYRKVLDIAM